MRRTFRTVSLRAWVKKGMKKGRAIRGSHTYFVLMARVNDTHMGVRRVAQSYGNRHTTLPTVLVDRYGVMARWGHSRTHRT